MAKILEDVRKIVKAFDAQVAKEQTAVPDDENSVRVLKDHINEAIVNDLPDETKLSTKAEASLFYIEEIVQRNAGFFTEEAIKARKAREAEKAKKA